MKVTIPGTPGIRRAPKWKFISIKWNFFFRRIGFKISSLFCLAMCNVGGHGDKTRASLSCSLCLFLNKILIKLIFEERNEKNTKKSYLFRAWGHFFAILRQINLEKENSRFKCVNLFDRLMLLLMLLNHNNFATNGLVLNFWWSVKVTQSIQ